RSEATEGGDRKPGARSRPELGAQNPERELRLGADRGHRLGPGAAVLRRVRGCVSREERTLAVGEQRGGRMLGVEVLESAHSELVAQLGMRRAADPKRMPGA